MNFYRRLKLAIRGNIPTMEHPDIKDPYRHKQLGDGEGWDMQRPGNEDTLNDPTGMGSGFGTRFRRFAPTDFSETGKDEYSQQVEPKDDIPTPLHYLMDDNNNVYRDPPTDDLQFDDERDSPFVADNINGRRNSDPMGPFNQHRGLNIMKEVRQRIR